MSKPTSSSLPRRSRNRSLSALGNGLIPVCRTGRLRGNISGGFMDDIVNSVKRKRGVSSNTQQRKTKRFSLEEIKPSIRTLAKSIILAAKNEENANCVFSPVSINVVLSFVAAGAEGSTQEQLLSFLQSTSIDELNSFSSKLVTTVLADGSALGGPRLSFVNGAWIDQSLSFKPDFKNVADSVYKARSTQVDFKKIPAKVTNEVNNWAEKETKGLIKDLIPHGAVNGRTRLILANALYFKGVWKQKFDKSLTRNRNFRLSNGRKVKVPFMTSRKKQYISVYDGFRVLRLPYEQGKDKGRRFSMYFYLPDADDELQDLVEKISNQPEFVELHSPRSQVPVGDFRIPKFKISYGFEASKILKNLGLVSPFTEGEGLTNMVNGHLFVSHIFHKSFIEINEQGTKAAAVTAAVISVGWAMTPRVPEEKVDFVADHPFIFLLREDSTGAVLFVGSMLNPAAP